MNVAKKYSLTPSHIIGIILIASVATTSTVVIPNLYDPTRNSPALALIYLSLAGITLTALSSKKNTLSVNKIDLVFCSWILLDTFYFPSYLSTMGILQNTCLIILYLFVRINKTHIRPCHLYISAVTALFILSVHGYAQYTGILPSYNPYFPITGAFRNPALFAGLLAVTMVPVVAVCLSRDIPTKQKIIAAVTLILALPIFYLADSRAAGIALALGLIYLVYRLDIFPIRLTASRIVLCSVMFFIVSGLIFWKVYHIRPDSAEGRVLIWKIATKMGKDNPVWGSGTHSFQSNYLHYQAQYFEKNGTAKEKQLASNNYLAYNEPLRIWVEQGIPGIVIYLLSVLGIVFYINPKDGIGTVAKTSILVLVVFGLFSYPVQAVSLSIWPAIMVAMLANRIENNLIMIRCNRRIYLPTILLLTVCIASAAILQHRACTKLHKILSAKIAFPHPDKEIQAFAELSPYLRGDVGYLATYARKLYLTKNYQECIRQLRQWEKIYPVTDLYILWGDCLVALAEPWQKAEAKYLYASRIVPRRQKARVRLAILYSQNGNNEKGLQLAKEILTEPVSNYGFGTFELHRQLKQEFNIK